MLLKKEDILKASDLETNEVDVPEWGGKIRLKSMTAGERDRFEEEVTKMREKKTFENIRAKFLALCIVDENNELLFTGSDIQELGKKSAKVIDRLFTEAQSLNGLGDKDVEELSKN